MITDTEASTALARIDWLIGSENFAHLTDARRAQIIGVRAALAYVLGERGHVSELVDSLGWMSKYGDN